ncbi:hypothetical protein HYR99_31185 [Candidatus Poribacteria bacterium]|nr:hypothetical protein [Candidatus Poribacteria bacterium]
MFRERFKSIREKFTSGGLDHSRLASEISVCRIRINHRKQLQEKQNKDFAWADTANEFLNKTDEAVRKNDIDTGWKHLQAAQQIEIFGFEKNELIAKAELLRAEVDEKLSSWRKQAATTLLNEEMIQKKLQDDEIDAARECVYQAAQLRDEHFNNEYFKIHRLRNQLTVLLSSLFLASVALPILAGFRLLPSLGGWRTLTAIEILGALGGALNVAYSIARTPTGRIPKQITHFWITMMRPLLGAATAIVIYIFLRAQILNFGLTGDKILAISVIAGYSGERLVSRAVESVTGKEGQDVKT